MPDVLELAGIGPAIHLPMKTYSSGMGARLRFAIAAAARPQILLIDEALATGDAAIKERSEERMAQIRKRGRARSSSSRTPRRPSRRCAPGRSGSTRASSSRDGPAYETARAYRWWAWNIAKGETAEGRRPARGRARHAAGDEDAPARAPSRRRHVQPAISCAGLRQG